MPHSYQQLENLPPELGTAVLQWILSVADTKHRIGWQCSHWVTGTPALEAAVGSAAITQDELGHARSLYGILRHHPDAPEGMGAENDLEAREVYYAPAALTPRWDSWLAVIAINNVLDSALSYAVAATEHSTFLPLAGRTAKILQEERFHRMFGRQWLARLLRQDERTKANMVQMLDWAWSIAVTWLGPDDDPITAVLTETGILQVDSATIRTNWLAAMTSLFDENGLSLPAVEMNWAGWNGRFRHINHA